MINMAKRFERESNMVAPLLSLLESPIVHFQQALRSLNGSELVIVETAILKALDRASTADHDPISAANSQCDSSDGVDSE